MDKIASKIREHGAMRSVEVGCAHDRTIHVTHIDGHSYPCVLGKEKAGKNQPIAIVTLLSPALGDQGIVIELANGDSHVRFFPGPDGRRDLTDEPPPDGRARARAARNETVDTRIK